MTLASRLFGSLTFRRALVGLTLILVLLALPLIAFGENVQNDVTVGGNDTFVLGSSTIVNYRIQDTGPPLAVSPLTARPPR